MNLRERAEMLYRKMSFIERGGHKALKEGTSTKRKPCTARGGFHRMVRRQVENWPGFRFTYA